MIYKLEETQITKLQNLEQTENPQTGNNTRTHSSMIFDLIVVNHRISVCEQTKTSRLFIPIPLFVKVSFVKIAIFWFAD